LWAVGLIAHHSRGSFGILGYLVLVYGGIGIALLWLLGLALARFRVGGIRYWLIVPACVAAVALLPLGRLPLANPLFRLRFELSRDAFAAAAEAHRADPDRATVGRVGWLRVESSEVFRGQVRFVFGPCGVVDACGVVHAPEGPPEPVYEDRFYPLGDRWYYVYQGF
jgi:hypothetical protein